MNISFSRLIILNRYFSVLALMVFKILCFLVDEIFKLRALACSFNITY
jgi:hypothetical protein